VVLYSFVAADCLYGTPHVPANGAERHRDSL
jgi:hypothetical protein